jgi:parallel beta-helix repeat protein
MLKPSIRLALIAALAFALLPASAQASHVQCGDVITHDTTLDSDLIDCPGDGVIIGADNITLDLSGHTIDGVVPESRRGVNVTTGHDGVTVENGRIQEFAYGVAFQYSDHGVASRLSIEDTSAGFGLFDSADDNLVVGNSVHGAGDAVIFLPLISQFPLLPPVRNVIRGNVFSGNEYGVFGNSNYGLIERNAIRSNTDSGIVLGYTAASNRIARNVLTGNGSGIMVQAGTSLTTIAENRITASAGDGIGVTAALRPTTVVERNVSSGNGDDGIDVDDPKTSVAKNTANDNGDLGIEAVSGTSDGGGNRARGNGNPLQCLNVFCK